MWLSFYHIYSHHLRNSNFFESLAVHSMYVLYRVVHINCNLLPTDKTKITLFKNRLIFHIRHRLYNLHYLTLQVNKPVNISVDLLLQVNNLAHGICHCRIALVRIVWHIRQGRCAFRSKLIQRCDLLYF